MKYEKAKAEVVLFDNSDVVTTSGCNNNAQMAADSGVEDCESGYGNRVTSCGDFLQAAKL